MLRFLIVFLVFFAFFSCNENKAKVESSTEKVKDPLTIDTPEASHQLIEFSPEFMEENRIDQWLEFKKFKEAMEDMSQLNPSGIMTFISELYKLTSALLKAPFPENFDKLPIYGRIKVVQTQIIKCHFYAANQQNEKLNQALDELYSEYNILMKRVISVAEDNQIQLDSSGIDLPTFQDSKINPERSRK
jgi:hypothetical protein